MIISISIALGVLVAYIAYRILFYDSSDFWQGCGKFTFGILDTPRRGKWIWQSTGQQPSAEDLEDEGWSSGIRFFLFLALSCGSGYFTYYELHKHFG